jgi:hypothetical protein
MIIERTRNELIFRLLSSIKLDELQDLANLFVNSREFAIQAHRADNGYDKSI